MLLIFKYISNLMFRMLQHTSSEVTIRLSSITTNLKQDAEYR